MAAQGKFRRLGAKILIADSVCAACRAALALRYVRDVAPLLRLVLFGLHHVSSLGVWCVRYKSYCAHRALSPPTSHPNSRNRTRTTAQCLPSLNKSRTLWRRGRPPQFGMGISRTERRWRRSGLQLLWWSFARTGQTGGRYVCAVFAGVLTSVTCTR